MAVQPKEHYALGFHPTQTCGVFGAAITASKLLGLTPAQTQAAVGIAGSMAAGSMEFLAEGAWTKRIHPGLAAQNGIQAALLAAEGFSGPLHILEGRDGFLHGYSRHPIAAAAHRRSGRVLRDPAHRGEAARLLPLHAGTHRRDSGDDARASDRRRSRSQASKWPCSKRDGELCASRAQKNIILNRWSTRSSRCRSAPRSRCLRGGGAGSVHARADPFAGGTDR